MKHLPNDHIDNAILSKLDFFGCVVGVQKYYTVILVSSKDCVKIWIAGYLSKI